MSSDKYTLGVDIGGTNLRMGLVSCDGELFAFEKQKSETVAGDNAVLLLGNCIEDYISRHNVRDRVEAACIGFPATVNKARTTVLNAPNIKGFDGVPVGMILRERLGIPVYIEKDVNLLLIGDMLALATDALNVVACYIGTGIGNAIMIDGNIITGANGVAGELGHIPFGDSKDICGCGNIGCAEAVAGGVYLAKLREQEFTGTEMDELFAVHGGHPQLTEYTERLARIIAAEVNIIDPELLLLGGGVVEMKSFPKESFEAEIMSHVRRPLPYSNLKIVYSPTDDGTNGVIGAGLSAWRKIK